MERDLGKLPRWDVTNIFPSLEAEPYLAAVAELDRRLAEHEAALDRDGIGGPKPRVEKGDAKLSAVVEGYIQRANWLIARIQTLDAFVNAHTTTNTFDDLAKKRQSELEAREVRLNASGLRFLAWSKNLEGRLDALVRKSPVIATHRFPLEEAIEHSKHLMSEPEELLASDLAPVGAWSWSKLHGVVTSQIQVDFERDGKTERIPMSKLRTLATDPDPEIRRRAYEAELAAWKAWQEPIAACMNGVKGWGTKLNGRRGWKSAIEPALLGARIDRATLDALLDAMRGSLPTFRRYLHAKARALKKERLDWWDLFAPVARSTRTWRYDEAERYVVGRFGTFSDRLASFARRAFDGRWVDGEPRVGKVGGAFCMDVPEAKESRVLMNFDGSFDQVLTLAHELGHGFHNEVLKDVEQLRQQTPMTLAETASIFCETIVFHAALADTQDPAETLGILETNLTGVSQVVVDIYSRYLFETRVYERRAESELSASDFSELMLACQREAYGDGLSEKLHPYMWAVKPHYYFAGVTFYNYPYAFGLLFGLGLYALYRQRGASFIPEYESLLGSTGLGQAADLARRFGIDIRSKAFWDGGLAEVASLVDRYEALVAKL